MDRQYIIENEIAEKYLLGKLDPAEQTAYETFLQQDEESRDELEMQKLLLGGLQAIGREELRSDLRGQVRRLRAGNPAPAILPLPPVRQSDFNSGMMLRIAAGLFILVCAPLLYKYYQTNSSQSEIVQAKSDLQQAADMRMESTDELQERDDAAFAADAVARQDAGGSPPETAGQRGETAIASSQPAEQIAARKKRLAAPSRIAGDDSEESTLLAGESEPPLADLAGADEMPAKEKGDAALKKQLSGTAGKNEREVVSANEPLAEAGQTVALQDAFTGSLEGLQQRGAGAAAPAATLSGTSDGDYLAYRSDPQPAVKSEAQEYKSSQNVRQFNSSERHRFALPQFRFTAGEQVIYVSWQLMRKIASRGSYKNDRFPVRIRRDAQGQLNMDWQVNEAFFDYPLSEIELRKYSDSELRIVIRDSLTYRVDLQQDSTEAVLINP